MTSVTQFLQALHKEKKKKREEIHFCYILIYSYILFIALNIPFIHRPSETLFPQMLDWKYRSNL